MPRGITSSTLTKATGHTLPLPVVQYIEPLCVNNWQRPYSIWQCCCCQVHSTEEASAQILAAVGRMGSSSDNHVIVSFTVHGGQHSGKVTIVLLGQDGSRYAMAIHVQQALTVSETVHPRQASMYILGRDCGPDGLFGYCSFAGTVELTTLTHAAESRSRVKSCAAVQ